MPLRPAELSKEWQEKRPRGFYALFGEDDDAKKEALGLLKSKADPLDYREFHESEAADRISEIISELQTLPLSSDRRIVVVECPRAAAALKKSLVEYLENPSASSTLVLVGNAKPDAKDALYALALKSGALCVFPKPKGDEAVREIKKEAEKSGKDITDEAAEFLVREIGPDRGLLKQELENLIFFAPGKTIGAREAAESLGYRRAADPFAVGRLIEKRLGRESLSALRDFFEEGKPQDQAFRAFYQINAAVFKQLKAKTMLASHSDRQEASRRLGLHPYWDRDFFETLSKLGGAKLKKDLTECLRVEARLKSQSRLDPCLEVEELVRTLCRTESQEEFTARKPFPDPEKRSYAADG